VIDRETRKKYGKCEVPVKVQGTTDEAFAKITLKEAECEIKSTVKGLENEVIGICIIYFIFQVEAYVLFLVQVSL
jgi:cob(I)alamin adenosyltransferase